MDRGFVDTLNELIAGSGLSNNQIAHRIGVDAAQVGRWRKGRGRPRPENLVRLGAVFGVDYKWLWSLAYPEGVPAHEEEEQPLDPRLAAFLSELEVRWHEMDSAARDVAERGARAIFQVAAANRLQPPRDNARDRNPKRPMNHGDQPGASGITPDSRRWAPVLLPA